MERDASSQRNPPAPQASLSASSSTQPPRMPRPIVVNPGGMPTTAASGIQVGAQVQWEYDGVKYYAEELRFMPMHYRFIQEYMTMCSFYISGLDQRMKEYPAVEVLGTCNGWWPPRNCGVLAMHILRKASYASPEGPCISGGGFIRFANRELAQAFMRRTNGISYRVAPYQCSRVRNLLCVPTPGM